MAAWPRFRCQNEKFDVVDCGRQLCRAGVGARLSAGARLRRAHCDRRSRAVRARGARLTAALLRSGPERKPSSKALGVWQAIAGEAEAMTSIEISDSALQDGMRPARLTYDAHTPDGQPAAYMVPAAALQRGALPIGRERSVGHLDRAGRGRWPGARRARGGSSASR